LAHIWGYLPAVSAAGRTSEIVSGYIIPVNRKSIDCNARFWVIRALADIGGLTGVDPAACTTWHKVALEALRAHHSDTYILIEGAVHHGFVT
jgi:hypothetical protein